MGAAEKWLREVGRSLRDFAEASIVGASIAGSGLLVVLLSWFAQAYGKGLLFENAELIMGAGTTAIVLGVFMAFHKLRIKKDRLAKRVAKYEKGIPVIDGPIKLRDDLKPWSIEPKRYEIRGFLVLTEETKTLRCLTLTGTANILEAKAVLHASEPFEGWVPAQIRQLRASMTFSALRLEKGSLIHFLAVAPREFNIIRITLGPQLEPTRQEELRAFFESMKPNPEDTNAID